MRSYDDYRRLVEQSLDGALTRLGDMPDVLRRAMAYSLQAGGKRLRPVLLLAASEACGGSVEEALPFACALEMIHTYSLIHDDLPAMDNDDLRRGKPTNHKVFGEGMAILAGDGLLHAAMETMLRAACERKDRLGLLAAEAIARRSGVTGMVAGQTVDVTEEGETPTMARVSYIHAHKTADLLTAPLEAGMLLAGAAEETVAAGVEYGYHLGLAFQIVDDLLDVTGDAALLGKNTGMDAALGKQTWVAVRGVDGARRDAEAHIDAAERAAEKFDQNMNFFKTLARETLKRVQ